MTMKRALIGAAALGLLMAGGCELRGEQVELATIEESLIVTNINPPKRFYVTLHSARGEHWRVYIAKKCPAWVGRVRVGDRILVPVQVSRDSRTGVVTRQPDSEFLRAKFCD